MCKTRNVQIQLNLYTAAYYCKSLICRVPGTWSTELLCSEAVHDDQHKIEISEYNIQVRICQFSNPSK